MINVHTYLIPSDTPELYLNKFSNPNSKYTTPSLLPSLPPSLPPSLLRVELADLCCI